MGGSSKKKLGGLIIMYQGMQGREQVSPDNHRKIQFKIKFKI